jgi:hypothetical protein
MTEFEGKLALIAGGATRIGLGIVQGLEAAAATAITPHPKDQPTRT